VTRRGKNKEFLAKQVPGTPLPAPNEERDKGGRFATELATTGKAFALEILNDPDYRRVFRERAIAGFLPPAVEVHLLRLGWGDIPKDDRENEEFRLRFDEVRRLVRELVSAAPQHASLLEARVIGASRVLPMPRLAVHGQVPEPDDERSE
jgi:hypothetical protein